MTYLRNWEKVSVYFSIFLAIRLTKIPFFPNCQCQMAFFGMIVHFSHQILKSIHLVCLSFWDMSCDPEFRILISVQKMWPQGTKSLFSLVTLTNMYLLSILGQRRVCSYYRFTNDNQFDQTTCGGRSFARNMAPPVQLEGRSLFDQRAEELMTHTGSLRGSFVS